MTQSRQMINDTEHENHSHDFNNKSQKKVHTHTYIYTHLFTLTYMHLSPSYFVRINLANLGQICLWFAYVCCVCRHSIMSNSLQPHGLCPSGFSGHGIFQARILEWVAISSSGRSSWPRHRTRVPCTAGVFFTSESPEKPMICLCYMLSHFSHVQFCDPMDYSLPGSSVYRIFQARILEWIAICIHKCLLNEKINICYNFKQ